MSSTAHSYGDWSVPDLTTRILELEKQLKELQTSSDKSRGYNESPEGPSSSLPSKAPKPFDWSKHSTRVIALKFAYIGRNYNGFEHHANNQTPLPTVEEVVWRALMKAKLINPGSNVSGGSSVVDWEGCNYSKCGRTDRGVNAFGQVIGIRVRSSRPVNGEHSTFDDDRDELPYVRILNSLLPSDIRMLAWCPALPPDFSARFSCRSRHYKYYFTQPAFTPTPGVHGIRNSLSQASSSQNQRREGWLDIPQMQEAARLFLGLHDFRNFCKIDPSKQIYDYRRRIFRSEIRALTVEELPAAYISGGVFRETSASSSVPGSLNGIDPQIYVFDLQGSAFLWHQVRHMVAVLFLVGQGLELPSVISDMLDTTACAEKPHYDMADETPLVLWNCTYPYEGDDPLNDSLDWRYVGGKGQTAGQLGVGTAKYGIGGAVDEMWALYRKAKMDEIIKGSLLNVIAHQPDAISEDPAFDLGRAKAGKSSQKVFSGGDSSAYRGVYMPLLKRKRLRNVEVINREYAQKHELVEKAGARKIGQAMAEGEHIE